MKFEMKKILISKLEKMQSEKKKEIDSFISTW